VQFCFASLFHSIDSKGPECFSPLSSSFLVCSPHRAVCVCVYEREREREKEMETEREKNGYACVSPGSSLSLKASVLRAPCQGLWWTKAGCSSQSCFCVSP